jgi:hypothetical protein
MPDAVTLMVAWVEPQFRSMLIKMADAMAHRCRAATG